MSNLAIFAQLLKKQIPINYKAGNKIGVFTGADILVTDSISVNAKGRFLDSITNYRAIKEPHQYQALQRRFLDEMVFSANAVIRF